jgi:hypothetical protein
LNLRARPERKPFGMTSDSVALASKMLALRAGRSPDAKALAAATRAAYDDVARIAASLIGPAGVDALTGRALHLAQREHPCLKQLPQPDPPGEPFARIVGCLQQQDAPVAAAAAGGLFATLIELLVTLIGKPLTTRLVRQAWPDVFAAGRIEEP